MSASHTPSPGTTPSGNTPNGGAPASSRRRPKPPADPLIRRKKPGPQRPTSAARPPNAGPTAHVSTAARPTIPQPFRPVQPNAAQASSGEYEDTPVYSTKKALLADVRRHVMRLMPSSSAKAQLVDPTDESTFTRPIRLHRRDPRMNPLGNWKEGDEQTPPVEENTNPVDDKERARLEASKAERRAEREANLAQIAPSSAPKKPTTTTSKKNKFQKKTQQVYHTDDPVRKKERQLRYEEYLPWHLEDFDNKNVWAGSYEAALSDKHVLLRSEHGADGSKFYNMVPLEKWYKFTAKNQFKALSIEEAEARMRKNTKDPRWFMGTQKVDDTARRDPWEQRAAAPRLFTRKGERGEGAGRHREDEEGPEVSADVDDIDYDYEEAFADDEENELFGGNTEENQEAEVKIRREQMQANIFELKEEKDYDKEEEEEKKRAEDHKKLSKKVQKALMKREKNYVYEDDSEGNPYASESESEDSEAERLKEEEQKKDDEDAKAKEDPKKAGSSDKPASGSSSKGTNTPSGRPKHLDPLRKSIKRPGSPNLSEASGNESSSRKKSKKKHPTSQPGESSASVGASLSRPVSPGNLSSSSAQNAQRKSSVIKLNVDPNQTDSISKSVPNSKRKFSEGSGSDGDGNEGRRKKAKGSPAASPNTSRAGSPAATGGPNGAPPKKSSKSGAALPSAEAIRATVPTEGMPLNVFFQNFAASRDTAGYKDLILANAYWDVKSKMLYPLGEAQRRKEQRKQRLMAEKEASQGTSKEGQE